MVRNFAWLSAFLIFFTSAAAASIECAEPPSQTEQQLLIDAKGEIGKLGPLVGAELEGRVSSVIVNIFEKYPNADKLVVVQALTSLTCNFLRDSDQLSDKEKIQYINSLSLKLIDLISGVNSPPDFKFTSNIEKSEGENVLFSLDSVGGKYDNFQVEATQIFDIWVKGRNGVRYFVGKFDCSLVNFFECRENDARPIVFFRDISFQISSYYSKEFHSITKIPNDQFTLQIIFYFQVQYEDPSGRLKIKRYRVDYGFYDGFFGGSSYIREISEKHFLDETDPDSPAFGGIATTEFGMMKDIGNRYLR